MWINFDPFQLYPNLDYFTPPPLNPYDPPYLPIIPDYLILARPLHIELAQYSRDLAGQLNEAVCARAGEVLEGDARGVVLGEDDHTGEGREGEGRGEQELKAGEGAGQGTR